VVEIALTSGSTGAPKLASLHAGLKQATCEAFTSRLEVTAEDRVLIMSPLTQGIGGMCLYCLRLGAALVMLREPRFTAEHTLRTAARSRASLLVGVPTNVIRMLDSPSLSETDLSAARCTAVAGAPMPSAVARAWETRTGSRVCVFYGSMDAGQLAVGSPSDPPEKRWTTVGRPHDCAQAMTTSEGEICMRGPTVQERYWGEDHGPYSEDGWVHMGDLGFVDDDGYLHVTGRIRDLVIRGGANVNPHEVEAVLRSHPDIADVCVVGRPDRELGERAVAFVVARRPLTLEELRDHLQARGLAKYKWPEFLELIEEIPLAGPGKVDRRLLAQRAAVAAPASLLVSNQNGTS
jgi:acyl-CoA synthetase (AMP-forming)/AMP-acid ligase II